MGVAGVGLERGSRHTVQTPPTLDRTDTPTIDHDLVFGHPSYFDLIVVLYHRSIALHTSLRRAM